EPNLFTAPGLDRLLDSPVELSRFATREWQVSGQTIRLVVHHLGEDKAVTGYAEELKKVVREQIAIFGALPDFDHGVYTFIACYLPWAAGDGMEHRNSTVLTSRAELKAEASRLLGTAAHEFFHAWNVERLRPRSLEPFRWDSENLADELWFAEGFTSYYGKLTVMRTGAADLSRFAELLAGDLSAVLHSPGRRYSSPARMSRQAAFTDGAAFRDPLNHANTYISYYDYGAVIALALDLTLRTQF
ncbi:MAG: M61 family peptidase, partial [bacterium]|nr:M61 family peptidase [bacterium]